MNDDILPLDIINNIFKNNFEIHQNYKINNMDFLYFLKSTDKIGRTISVSNEPIEYYYDYELCFVSRREIKSSLKDYVESSYQAVKSLINLDHHHETIINFITFSEIESNLIRKVKRFSKTKLLSFGFKGHIQINLILIDSNKKIVCGNKQTTKLQNCLRRELYNE